MLYEVQNEENVYHHVATVPLGFTNTILSNAHEACNAY